MTKGREGGREEEEEDEENKRQCCSTKTKADTSMRGKNAPSRKHIRGGNHHLLQQFRLVRGLDLEHPLLLEEILRQNNRPRCRLLSDKTNHGRTNVCTCQLELVHFGGSRQSLSVLRVFVRLTSHTCCPSSQNFASSLNALVFNAAFILAILSPL